MVQSRQSSFEPTWTVTVPEHAALALTPAGPFIRSCAFAVDLIVRCCAFGVLLLVLWGLFALGALLTGGRFSESFLWGSAGLLLLLYFALAWFYHVVFEAGSRGQTPGKRLLGLQVVDRDGRPPGWGGSMLRNLLRWVDWLPSGYLLGGLVASSDRGFRRLGDLAAGTLVVYRSTFIEVSQAVHNQHAGAEQLAQRLPKRILQLLDPAARQAIVSYLDQRARFSQARREELAAHLARPLALSAGLPPPAKSDLFLCAVAQLLAQEQQQRDGATARAVLAQRQADWERQQELIESTHSWRGPGALQVADLHRATCADLALADAYQLPLALRQELSDLVAQGHALIHQRETRQSMAELGRAAYALPGQVRRDPCTWIGLAVFFLPFIGAWWLAQTNPAWAAAVVGEDALGMFESMYRSADFSEGRGPSAGAGMTSFYIVNNVSIALTCYAAGFLAGVGALAISLWNAVVLGAVFGFMGTVEPEVYATFLEFVTAHGPFELTGIAICTGAGLRLGWGMWSGQGRSLAAALRHSGRASLPLVIGGALLVAAAAPIEGFISPSSLPLWFKQGVGAACSLLIVLALVGTRWWPRMRRGHA